VPNMVGNDCLSPTAAEAYVRRMWEDYSDLV
jgi:hypothetical protein